MRRETQNITNDIENVSEGFRDRFPSRIHRGIQYVIVPANDNLRDNFLKKNISEIVPEKEMSS